jgi:para-aminobenzoate synthetase component 1
MGEFDGQNLDSGVMIRFIERKSGQLIFKSGGGITVFSELEKEYIELIQKVYLPF